MNAISNTLDLPKFVNDCEPLSSAGKLRSPYELLGVLTSICSAPDLISPSEWMPLVWQDDADEAAFDTTEQAQAIMGHLMTWSNYCASSFMQENAFALPDDLSLDEAGRPKPELSAFAKGYLIGNEWLKDVWDSYVSEDESAESQILGSAMILMMLCYQPEARENFKNLEELPDLLGAIHKDDSGVLTISSCLAAVGQLGRVFYEEAMDFYQDEPFQMQTPVINEMKGVGRNDPCPCGSGKKYKKCCLN